MLELKTGDLVGGRYEVVRLIGTGGMGAVYCAADLEKGGASVALKVLHPLVTHSQRNRERFKNEAKAARRLVHPNIVQAGDIVEDGSLLAMTMEFIEGEDLLGRMRRGPIRPIEAAGILAQVAEGLAAIHAEGIIHRDLKPENILIRTDGLVKISDFGVARLQGGVTLTPDGMMVGTAKYLSPEYIETGDCDHRGDIFALGVLGYEMISGRSPFSSDLRITALHARIKTRVPALQDVAPWCPLDLAQVIEKSMNVRLTQRYISAKLVAADLDSAVGRLQQGLGIS